MTTHEEHSEDKPYFWNNPLFLGISGAVCLSIAFLRVSIPIMTGEADLPYHCTDQKNPDHQALVEKTPQGIVLLMVDRHDIIYKSTNAYGPRFAITGAHDYCRGSQVRMAEEKADGQKYYECKGLKGQFGKLELISNTTTRVNLGGNESDHTDQPAHLLRAEVMKFCMGIK